MPLIQLKYDIALTHFPKYGPRRLYKLRKYFKNAHQAFYSNINELIQAGIEDNVAQEFIAMREEIEPDKIIEKLDKEGINVLSIESEAYPKLLKQIYDPPQLLFYKGEFKSEDEFSVAVVGTRKFTHYGKQAVETITKELAKAKLTIISGLALGIDALAHAVTLEVKGRTIAVLGSGLDKENIYPASNRFLADKIIKSGGALVPEFPIGTPPLRHHFPQRNRLISGLALGVLVVEAGEKSGALITARHALDQDREVFAVPGTIYSPVSQGPNQLIKQGAQVVSTAADILNALDLTQVTTYVESRQVIPENPQEEKILTYLTHEPMHVDEIVRLTNLSTSLVASTLTIMEVKGMAKNLGGMRYVLAR